MFRIYVLNCDVSTQHWQNEQPTIRMCWVVKLRWNTGWQEIFIFCRSSNHFAFREVVKVKKSSAWNVSAKECFVDVVSSFSCQPSELRFTRKTRFWNRDLENRQKSPVHCQNRTETGGTHRYKAATNCGKYWDTLAVQSELSALENGDWETAIF